MLNDADREKFAAIQHQLADQDPRWAYSFYAKSKRLGAPSNNSLKRTGQLLGIIFGTLLGTLLLIVGAAGTAILTLVGLAVLVWWMCRDPHHPGAP